MPFPRQAVFIALICFAPFHAQATQAKIDADTCSSLRLEQIKFRQSGLLDDMSKGAAWGKANLSPERMREIEHYMELDEKVKFGCRDAKLSPAAARASEAAARIEINSDADPTAPAANDPPKPGSAAAKAKPKKVMKKKAKPSNSKAQGGKSAKSNVSDAEAAAPPPPPVVMQSVAGPEPTGGSGTELPVFGFGDTTVLPHSAP